MTQYRKSSDRKMSMDSQDIVELILEDHKALKDCIKIMKDSDKDMALRAQAFEEFCILLPLHAKPEERTLYRAMKSGDMREEGLEGDVEHHISDQLLEEAKNTDDGDLWSARVKVLAEVVEHHIEEEEDEMLPQYRGQSKVDERRQLGEEFLRLKTAMLTSADEPQVAEPAPLMQ
ncbi:MAG: hemerythrin domain-containing protein [Bdellovibrionaceae bacterium]|nr:hemerythrin domain-containing protein [Pseudobdellovibrionaceae bacterium]